MSNQMLDGAMLLLLLMLPSVPEQAGCFHTQTGAFSPCFHMGWSSLTSERSSPPFLQEISS